MRHHSRLRGIVSAAAGLALMAGTIGLAASPASAATVGGPVSGPIGIQQSINVSGYAPYCTLTANLVLAGSTVTLPPSGQTVTTDADGNATLLWTPQALGPVSAIAIDGVTSTGQLCGTPYTANLTNVNITQVPTTLSFSAPNVAQVGVATTITIIAQSQSPSTYRPTGTVVVTDQNGNVLQKMGLTPYTGQGQSYAYWRFTPPTTGSYTFLANYSGDTYATAAPQVSDVMQASPTGGSISLAAPSVMTQGVPVNLVATVVPTTVQGSVGFTLNGQPISASVPLVNGQASFLWTPNTVGAVTVGANYMTNAGASGSTTDKVTIVAGPASKDVITLTQPGFGTWAPGGTYPLGNGSSITFAASTLSGAPVTLSENGPCSVAGLTLNVNAGSGSCSVTAASPGAAGYAAVQQNYTVTLAPGTQTATVAAPLSGTFKKGRVLVLEAAGQADTNAGQNINWKISKGKNSVCKLLYPNDGSVTLRLLKKGTCNVKGVAPAVPGQWTKYLIARSYMVK